jgi:hypothetical protein
MVARRVPAVPVEAPACAAVAGDAAAVVDDGGELDMTSSSKWRPFALDVLIAFRLSDILALLSLRLL